MKTIGLIGVYLGYQQQNITNQTSRKLQSYISIPICNIIHSNVHYLKYKNINHVGVLGTKYVMFGDFYKNILSENNIKSTVPEYISVKKLIKLFTTNLFILFF